MNISGTSLLGDASYGQPITVVDVTLNGSFVGYTIATSATVVS